MQSRKRHLAALCSLLLAACSFDAVSGEPDALEIELGRRPLPEPDYTPEELAALAHSPEVESNIEPFGKTPTPDKRVHVTMADGTRIALSLYFPVGFDPATTRAPTVYSETWYTYGVEARGMAIDLYRAAGFVVAIGDPRGFGASFGSQTGFLTEAQRRDQREVIAWLGSQPWSNEQVASVGISVSAMLAEAMLASGAPNLKAGIVRSTEFDQYSENLYVGGIPNLRIHGLIEMVLGLHRAPGCESDPAVCVQYGLGPVDSDTDLKLLQAAVLDHQANIAPDALRSVTYIDDVAGSSSFDETSPRGHLAQLREHAVPARIGASWIDGATAHGALARYAAAPDAPMQLVISASTHLGGLNGDPFAREAFAPAQPLAAEQFSADIGFLKNVLAGGRVERKIDYYVLGAGVWKTTEQWPPRGVQQHTLHLGRRSLLRQPLRAAGEREYQVDPSAASGAQYNRWASGQNAPVYYGDRRFTPGEKLSFDSAPVASDRELVGEAELCLGLRSDQTDGIVIAYLEDVAPDGRVTYLTEGELRLLHRKTASGGCDGKPGTARSFARADGAPVTPGELMQIEISFLPVAARIQAGHRLRLSLAGADEGTFPMVTETPATWSVAFGGEHGSKLTVPWKHWSAE